MWDAILFAQHNQRDSNPLNLLYAKPSQHHSKHGEARNIYIKLDRNQKDNVRNWFQQVYNLDVERYLEIDR
jgi:hypothetical protein